MSGADPDIVDGDQARTADLRPVIVAEGVSKVFRVGGPLSRLPWGNNLSRRSDDDDTVDPDEDDDEDVDESDEERPQSTTPERIHALTDVSFTVQAGTTFGVAGATGSGKSTLLRILGRTVPPTEGRIEIRGQVMPPVPAITRALEPRFTGRQNLPMLADLLGLPRQRLADRADEIFAFAELESHADIPVLRWARGFRPMFGEAIALHAEPQILLSEGAPVVGASEFRQRCYDRLAELRDRGMVIVMTCANHKQVRQLCDAAIWLDAGVARLVGTGAEVADAMEAVSAPEPEPLGAAGAGDGRGFIGPLTEEQHRALERRRAALARKLSPPVVVSDTRLVDEGGTPLAEVDHGSHLELLVQVSQAGMLCGGAELIGADGTRRRLAERFETPVPRAGSVRARAMIDRTDIPPGPARVRFRVELEGAGITRGEMACVVSEAMAPPQRRRKRPAWAIEIDSGADGEEAPADGTLDSPA